MNQKLTGPLDQQLFEKAFKKIIERHEILRTYFELKEGLVYQCVGPYDGKSYKLVIEDLRLADDLEKVVDHKTDEIAFQPFDLLGKQLFKVKLLRVSDEEHIIVFAIHHIIFDLWSQEVFFRELFHFYEAYTMGENPTLPEVTIQYRDYASWHNQFLQSDEMKVHEKYWISKLAGNLPLLNIPTDRPRPPRQTFVGNTLHFELSEELVLSVKGFINQHDVTLFVFLTAAVKSLLFRYSGQNDIIIGTPIADRGHPDLKDQLGCYINTIPIRDFINGEEEFNQIVQNVKESTLEGFEHQACPLDKIIELIDFEVDPGRSPLFDVSLAVSQEFDFDKFQSSSKHRLKVSPINKNLKISKTDLLFQFVDRGDVIAGAIQYNSDLFDQGRINRMIQHFKILIEAILSKPQTPISTINYMTEEERQITQQNVDLFSTTIETDF